MHNANPLSLFASEHNISRKRKHATGPIQQILKPTDGGRPVVDRLSRRTPQPCAESRPDRGAPLALCFARSSTHGWSLNNSVFIMAMSFASAPAPRSPMPEVAIGPNVIGSTLQQTPTPTQFPRKPEQGEPPLQRHSYRFTSLSPPSLVSPLLPPFLSPWKLLFCAVQPGC